MADKPRREPLPLDDFARGFIAYVVTDANTQAIVDAIRNPARHKLNGAVQRAKQLFDAMNAAAGTQYNVKDHLTTLFTSVVSFTCKDNTHMQNTGHRIYADFVRCTNTASIAHNGRTEEGPCYDFLTRWVNHIASTFSFIAHLVCKIDHANSSTRDEISAVLIMAKFCHAENIIQHHATPETIGDLVHNLDFRALAHTTFTKTVSHHAEISAENAVFTQIEINYTPNGLKRAIENILLNPDTQTNRKLCTRLANIVIACMQFAPKGQRKTWSALISKHPCLTTPLSIVVGNKAYRTNSLERESTGTFMCTLRYDGLIDPINKASGEKTNVLRVYAPPPRPSRRRRRNRRNRRNKRSDSDQSGQQEQAQAEANGDKKTGKRRGRGRRNRPKASRKTE